MAVARVLYMTDRYRVSAGYAPLFDKLVAQAGIRRSQIVTADIYNLVDKPLKKRRANEALMRFDPDKKEQIAAAFEQRVKTIKPSLIVCSCPASLGIFNGWDLDSATLEKMRGGVYYYGPDRIPVIITYPITAIHQKVDSRIVSNDDGDEDTESPYKVQQGNVILKWDWQKAGRYFNGRVRKLPEFSYSVCRTIQDCEAARDYLRDCVLVATDIETGNWPPQQTCIGYTGLRPNGAVHSFVFPFYDEFADDGCFWESEDDHIQAWLCVEEINNFPNLKTMQNGPYDCTYFVRDRIPPRNYLLDSQILWWSLYCELPKRLDFISSVLLDNYQYWKDDIKGEDQEKIGNRAASMERYWRYNALDCYNTLFNTLYLLTLMRNNKRMQQNYRGAFMRTMSGFRMSMRGMKADFARRDYHRANLEAERDTQLARLRYVLAEPEFNPGSPAQKMSLLYDVFGLQKRNARGRIIKSEGKSKALTPSAGAIPIKLAKSTHPMFKMILEIMESAMAPEKQISNVFGRKDPITGKVTGGIQCPSGRFLTSFNGIGAETNRYSSKKSNLWVGGNAQNIRGKYRDWMVADANHIILDIDYSQSDDVFIAYESGDPDKIAVVESGMDGHAVNGELFFGKSYDWIVAGKKRGDPAVVDPVIGIRQLSKRIVHGTNFQMAGRTLYVTMGRDAVVAAAMLLGFADAPKWSEEQLVELCALLMRKYRKKYKRLNTKEWYLDVLTELRSGFITNAFNYSRMFLGDPNDSATQREATAFIGQSDTADNMNRVMYEIDWGYMPENFRDGPNPDAKETPRMMDYRSHGIGFHLQVHDNFVTQLDLRHPKWQEAANNLLYVMNRPVIIKGREVRVKAEAAIGLRWGKNMLDWNGSPDELPRLVSQLLKEGKV